MVIDTHAHLNDEIYEGRVSEIINSEDFKSTIDKAFMIGWDLKSSIKAVEIANEYDNIYAIVGVHPNHAESVNEKVIDELRKLCENKKVIAIGEIGLDYHYENYDKEIQKKAFIKQLELANELKMPFSIHIRDAYQDVSEIIFSHTDLIKHGGVLHCYSGSVEEARKYLNLGLYLSFGGVVTFKNARHVLDVVREVPRDRYLSETDCPYLSPEPHRGEINYPQYTKYVVAKMAELKGLTVQEEDIKRNVKELFKV